MSITLADSSILFTHKEKPPEVMEGFIRVQPNLFKPIFPPCTHRVEKECRHCNGNNKKMIDHCQLKTITTFLMCYNCKERVDPIAGKALVPDPNHHRHVSEPDQPETESIPAFPESDLEDTLDPPEEEPISSEHDPEILDLENGSSAFDTL